MLRHFILLVAQSFCDIPVMEQQDVRDYTLTYQGLLAVFVVRWKVMPCVDKFWCVAIADS